MSEKMSLETGKELEMEKCELWKEKISEVGGIT